MSLGDLQKKIYKPGEEFEERISRPELFDFDQDLQKPEKKEWVPLKKKKKINFKIKLTPEQIKKAKKIGLILSVIFVIAAAVAVWHGLTSFDKSKVKIEIESAKEAVVGNEIIYKVKFKNQTKVTLEDVKLTFYFPEGSVPSQGQDLIQTVSVSDIKPDQEGQQDFSVKLVGAKDQIKNAKAVLDYHPSNFSARYNNEAKFASKIILVPLILDFDLPEQLVSDQTFNFKITYANRSDVDFKDLQIKVEYPAGFEFSSAVPQADEKDNVFNILELKANEENKIFIEGVIRGAEGESKSFKAQIGAVQNDNFVSYLENIEATKISIPPLNVTQTVNDSSNVIAQAGQTLTYKINYKNTINVGIKGVIISSKLESDVLDMASLSVEQGSYDGISQSVIWRAGNIPDLEFLKPGQSGQVSFSVKVKNPLPIDSYDDKNFVIINIAKVDSTQPPLALKDIQVAGQSVLETKVASQLKLKAQGFYNDDVFSNTGPIPPRVDQTTSYTIKLLLSNTSNDVDNVKVSVYLPPHVRWLNNVEPSDADVKYDQNTGQLTWAVSSLSAGTDIFVPAEWIAFQVSITPSLADVDKLVELIGQPRASGQDAFCGIELISFGNSIDTKLPDDPFVEGRGGVVIR